MSRNISPGEVRVLFVLLDSIEAEGRLRSSPEAARWREARRGLTGVAYETEGPILWNLLTEMDDAGVLTGSWIRERWLTIKAQVERSLALTSHPFATDYVDQPRR